MGPSAVTPCVLCAQAPEAGAHHLFYNDDHIHQKIIKLDQQPRLTTPECTGQDDWVISIFDPQSILPMNFQNHA